MKKNGLFIPSDIPAITYNKPTIESNSKQNGQIKPITNGYHSTPKTTRRLNSNTESKTSRRTSKERYNTKNSPHIQ